MQPLPPPAPAHAEYFSQFGKVTKVRLSRNKKNGKSKGYAFLEFSSAEVRGRQRETTNVHPAGAACLHCSPAWPAFVGRCCVRLQHRSSWPCCSSHLTYACPGLCSPARTPPARRPHAVLALAAADHVPSLPLSKQVAKIASAAMDGYMLFSQKLTSRVLPADEVHPDLFKGANRVFKQARRGSGCYALLSSWPAVSNWRSVCSRAPSAVLSRQGWLAGMLHGSKQEEAPQQPHPAALQPRLLCCPPALPFRQPAQCSLPGTAGCTR